MKCTKHSGLLLCLGYILNSSDSQVVRAESVLFTTQKHNAMTNIHNGLMTNIDKGLYNCCLFLDLSKAFDTVDH